MTGPPSTRSSHSEKGRALQIEEAGDDKQGTPLYNPDVDVAGIDEKKLLRKIDFVLLPWLSFLYLLSFLDRTSIGNAKLYGLETDLNITDEQYNIALMIFFFSYAIFEVPSNVFLKRLRPSIWLSLLMLLWGVMMTVQGLVHNYSGLLTMRWFLGVFEAGLFPGVNYYLSCWYKRSEFGIRAAIFFAAATISGAFGGLLAFGISYMDGIGGKPAWAWIFILEGLATVIAGILSFWIIQDFPDTAKFLSREERTVVVRRLQSDDQFSAAGESLQLRVIWKTFLNWKVWLCMLLYAGSDGPLYAFSLFLPSIINQLGYVANRANLLSIPVYVVACLVTISAAYFADRTKKRGYVNMVFLTVAMIGYIMLVASNSPGLSYAGTYLAACGIYTVIPNTIAWVSNNVEGSYKRGVTLGMVISFGNLNGAVTSNIYRSKDKPHYRLGHGVVILYIGLGLLSSIVYHFYCVRENAARDRGDRDEIIGEASTGTNAGQNGHFVSVEEARKEKGDEWSGYRYTT